MPRFACPSCKSVISVEAEQRGSVFACPSCGKKIRVPGSKSSDAIKSGAAARVRNEARDADPDMEEVRVTSKAPASARKQAPSRQGEEDDTPLHRSNRRRAAPRDKDGLDETDRAEDDFEDEEDDPDGADEERGGQKRRGKKKRRRRESGGGVGVSGVLGSIGGLAAVALFILFLSGPRWLTDFVEDKLVENGIPPIVAGVAILVLLIPLGLWMFFWMFFSFKGQILSALPDDIDFRATTPSKFRNLDREKLEEYTEIFESLGFSQLFDYTMKTELASGFARLFLNEEEGCYAEVNQGFAPGGESLPMRCTIVSHLEDGWSLTTTDRAPSAEIYLMRCPRALWRSLPDKEPDELLAHHRKMRKKIMKSLEVDLVEELSREAYFKREKSANRDRKDAIRERWTAGLLIDYYFFDHNPKYEWRGEYVEAG